MNRNSKAIAVLFAFAATAFIGTFLAFAVVGEKLTLSYFIGLILMLIGTAFVVSDTMTLHHTHIIRHEHLGNEEEHHHHNDFMNSEDHRADHARKK